MFVVVNRIGKCFLFTDFQIEKVATNDTWEIILHGDIMLVKVYDGEYCREMGDVIAPYLFKKSMWVAVLIIVQYVIERGKKCACS